jgi:hypothetical protein
MNQKQFAEDMADLFRPARHVSNRTWQITKDIPEHIPESEYAAFFASALEALFLVQFNSIKFTICKDTFRVGYNSQKACATAGVMICEFPS